MVQSKTRLYRIWHNMKTRCTNPNYDRYKYYGGKGIKVCDEWMRSFDAFAAWANSHGYTEELTLDRIDTFGDYTPENCRWGDQKLQQNNRSDNHVLTINGVTKTLQQWSDETGLSRTCIRHRVAAGWPEEMIMTAQADKNYHPRLVTYNGETKHLKEWAHLCGIPESTLRGRLNNGWPVEKAMTTPSAGRG